MVLHRSPTLLLSLPSLPHPPQLPLTPTHYRYHHSRRPAIYRVAEWRTRWMNEWLRQQLNDLQCEISPFAGLEKCVGTNIRTHGVWQTLLERMTISVAVFIICGHCSPIAVITSSLIELNSATTHCNGWDRGNQRSDQLFSLSSSSGSPQYRDRHVLIHNYIKTHGGAEEMRTKDPNERWGFICSSRATIMCMDFCVALQQALLITAHSSLMMCLMSV